MAFYLQMVCKSCKKEFIIMEHEYKDTINSGKYVCCPHCGSRKINSQNTSDDFKDCMKASCYKRIHGALRQVKH